VHAEEVSVPVTIPVAREPVDEVLTDANRPAPPALLIPIVIESRAPTNTIYRSVEPKTDTLSLSGASAL
jgi:hypothetical protein